MPRCIPADPVFTSAAEQQVWQALKQSLRPHDVLMANLRITDDDGDHEADVVVAMPDAGIVVVEVKGGRISHDGQRWRQGNNSRHLDPVAQARRCKYAIRDYLDRDPRWGRRRTRFAHAVAFPHSAIAPSFDRPECPRAMVLDRDDLPGSPAGMLYDLVTDQRSENPCATQDDVDTMVDVLSGRMLPQGDLIAEIAERAADVDLMTERQATILSALRAVPRVEVIGGAGSGKTWLALEQARRLSKAGQRVALTCYSRGLAEYLRRRVAGLKRHERPAYVGTFHGLGQVWGAPSGSDDDSRFWEERLPAEMARLALDLPDDQLFDAVVVDEAQDFADSWWPALLSALRDQERGGVYVFADEGQRVFARQGRAPLSLVPVLLDENLRNTLPIAQTFGSLTQMQMRYRGGDGDPVRFVACSDDEALGQADDEVEVLLEEGWPAEHVALLTTGKRHPEQVERQARGQGHYWESFYDADQVFYGHVLGFKGLERPAVVLAVNGFGRDERAREKLYVGLSRARDRLVVCGDPGLIRDIGGEGVAHRLGIT